MVEFKNSLYDNVLVVEWVSETQEYIEGEIFYFSIDNFCFSIYNVIRMRALLPQRRRFEMEVSYNKLWKLMIDKGMPNKSDLRTLTGIGTNTLAKLSKNQQVSMEVLMKICNNLDCDISDICEFTKEN